MTHEIASQIEQFVAYVAPGRTLSSKREVKATLLRVFSALNGHPITRPVLTGWLLNELREVGKKPSTVLQYQKALNQFLRWRADQGEPEITLRLRLEINKRKVCITEDDYKALLARLDHPMAPWCYGYHWPYAIRMAWYTGMRLGDCSQCRWDYLDVDRKILSFTPQKTSRHAVKLEIPLPTEFVTWLMDYKAQQTPSEYMAPTMAKLYLKRMEHRMVQKVKGKLYKTTEYSTDLGVQFNALRDSAGVDKGKTFHSFRHGIVTRLLARGLPPALISMITGQSVATVLEYNSGPQLETLQKALNYE